MIELEDGVAMSAKEEARSNIERNLKSELLTCNRIFCTKKTVQKLLNLS